jgi:protoporphyrinogen IX oxidase
VAGRRFDPRRDVTLEAGIWLCKFLHLTAVAVWMSGLLAAPFLMVQRSGLDGGPLHRLQRMVRFLYVVLASPAAFLAIGAGTALIFLRGTYVEWFTLKLVLVGALVGLHAFIGRSVLSVFAHKGRMSAAWAAAMASATSGVALAVLWVVLAKPDFDATAMGRQLMAPGALGEALGPVLEPVTSAGTP